ncbi:MAG: patatin-like phospholipase family protein [Solirubrobacteraceae bacterium]
MNTGSGIGSPDAPVCCEDSGILSVSARARYEASAWRWNWQLLRPVILGGEHREPIPSYTGLVESPQPGKIGIACSGGGIRSAAFSLGALQVLQGKGVFPKARYLAGVSGGSYIAAAFCMVRKTWQPGQPRPKKRDPGWDDSDPAVVLEHQPFFPGSPEEQYLRNRSSYLAPGAFGLVRLGYRVFLGAGINLLFIAVALVTFAFPLGLLYGWLYPSLTAHVVGHGLCSRRFARRGGGSEYRNTLCELLPLHLPSSIWYPIAGVAAFSVVLGGASILAFKWSGWVRQVAEVWSLRLLVLASGAAALLIGLPVLLSLFRAWGTSIPNAVTHFPGGVTVPQHPIKPTGGTSPATAAAVGAGGAATLGGAVLLQLRAEWTAAKAVAEDAGKVRQWYEKLAPWLRTGLASVIAGLIGPILTLALVLEAMSWVLNHPDPGIRWAWTGAFMLGFAVVYLFADLTTWSLHSFYRRRLCTAFALKRVAPPQDYPPIAPVAGSEDPPAGVAEARNYRQQVNLSETAIAPGENGQEWPTLLVCAAANVSDEAATPPGRRVTSFTFSATAMGGPLVGAVRTRELEEGCNPSRRSYFTLPAAVAMSGAALSPSMGKMTRGPLRFLMALANVRLGVWVPNPRRIHSFEGRIQPKPRPSYLVRELFGMNPLNAPYLYVTDGGHYENLGLVELLRRGCTEIYCFDASNDDFAAIGDALALARSELGVEIAIETKPLGVNKETGLAEADCVEAHITYPEAGAPPATLFYARLAMTAASPADVVAYHRQDSRFPHDPTADQLYTDQRFESYRALGAHAAATGQRLRGEAAARDPTRFS